MSFGPEDPAPVRDPAEGEDTRDGAAPAPAGPAFRVVDRRSSFVDAGGPAPSEAPAVPVEHGAADGAPNDGEIDVEEVGDAAAPEVHEGADASASVLDLRGEIIATLQADLRARDAKLRQVVEAYQAAQVEFKASRERLQREQERTITREKARIVQPLLSVLDDFDRAIEASPTDGAAGAVVEGIRLVRASFEKALAALGLERFDPTGAPFDPAVHDALTLMPVADPGLDAKVVATVTTGWRVGAEVLRHASVVVGKHSGEPAAEG